MDKQDKLQAVFDRVWAGAEDQGWRKASNGLTCVFTAKNGDHCHVGQLLVTPELVTMAMGADGDDPGIDSFSVRQAVARHWDTSFEFLTEIQNAHDMSETPEQARKNTIKVGHAFGLAVPNG